MDQRLEHKSSYTEPDKRKKWGIALNRNKNDCLQNGKRPILHPTEARYSKHITNPNKLDIKIPNNALKNGILI